MPRLPHLGRRSESTFRDGPGSPEQNLRRAAWAALGSRRREGMEEQWKSDSESPAERLPELPTLKRCLPESLVSEASV